MATAVGMTTAGSNRLRTTVAPRVLMQWQWQQPSVGSVTSNCTAPQRQAPFTVSAIGAPSSVQHVDRQPPSPSGGRGKALVEEACHPLHVLLGVELVRLRVHTPSPL